jgi:glycosyltransferase involved in cell wall biosynthesis
MDVAPSPTYEQRVVAKKHILYAITKANWGGAQRYVYDLAIASRNEGYLVSVAYGVPGELNRRLDEIGIRTIPLTGVGRDVHLNADTTAIGTLRALFKAERPDIVHLNSSKIGALGAYAARLEKVPLIIFTAHAWAFNEDRPWWQKILFKLVHAGTVLLSHRTICVSESVRNDMLTIPGAAQKMVVIHNGISEQKYLEREYAREKLWPEKKGAQWIGMLSELHPSKRVDDAITAFSLLLSTSPKTVLVVLGEGQERDRLEAIIHSLGLEDRVRLAGFVSEGSSYLKAFDYFLHTSRTDALAYAVIEAGLAGLPVVATRVGGIPEVIQNGISGILVPPLSTEKTSDALRWYEEHNESARTYGENLQTRIRTQFTKEQMTSNTLALYRTKV